MRIDPNMDLVRSCITGWERFQKVYNKDVERKIEDDRDLIY